MLELSRLHNSVYKAAGPTIALLMKRNECRFVDLWILFGFSVSLYGSYERLVGTMESVEYSDFVVQEAEWFIRANNCTNDPAIYESLVETCCKVIMPIDTAVADILIDRSGSAGLKIAQMVEGGFDGLVPQNKRGLDNAQLSVGLVHVWTNFAGHVLTKAE